jgi:hypothetical protein
VALKFPSVEFFQDLAERMQADRTTFEKLGYCDTRMGVAIPGTATRCFALNFEVYECTDVQEIEQGATGGLDFVLEADADVWREMLEAIREHDGADAPHTLNTLSHLGDRMRVAYEDPEGHDKFYRFMASIQAYFDLARDVELEFA